jgi:glycosyltransferase
LESVKSQTYPNIEHVVIDGASTDGCAEYLAQQSWPCLRFRSEPDNGIYDALNKGIESSTGEIIGFLHTDDLFASSGVLSHIASAFENPEVQVVYGDLEYVAHHDVDRVVRRWQAGRFRIGSLKFGWMPPHPTLFVRREVYERLGFFDPNYRIAGDYHSILKIFTNLESNVAYVPRVITKMRIGGASNGTLRKKILKSIEDRRALADIGIGGWGTVLIKNIRKIHQLLVLH